MPEPHASFPPETEQAAFAWVQRQHDGLSDDQALELHAWLEENPRHAAAFAHFQRHWAKFDRLAGRVKAEPVRRFPLSAAGAAPARRGHARFAPALGLAAAIAIGFFLWRSPSVPPPVTATLPPFSLPAAIERLTLPDGTVVELNRGARLSPAFTTAERRVHLLDGEASFAVAKDPAHPFIVEAGGVEVRAVGTAFNVRFEAKAVEVIVTEGKVQVATEKETVPLLEAGQATTVSLGRTGAPAVEALTSDQLARKLLWQPRLLGFDNQPLSEIVEEFNRRNPVRLSIDPKNGARRMTATFRSDNVEGFVRLLEQHFGITAERREGRLVVLTGR
ncbi:MAG: hypothetical protein RL091_3277 [Verrucomicrobiota bacterium]|jgi:transmembrane sensor